MGIKYVLLISRQGKIRLAKWFSTLGNKEKTKIIKDVTQLVLARRARLCNFLEYRDTKLVYRRDPDSVAETNHVGLDRYASLYFIAGIDPTDNELIVLEIIHRFVEVLDQYFGNVCELDLIFNFQKAYFVLDEILLAGEMQEPSKKAVLRVMGQQDIIEENENAERGWGDVNVESVARSLQLYAQEAKQSFGIK
ncbi:AP-1 adaptor complex sigma subunit Aps1 [Dimargaris verticillata]|uniref:AP complex subunit sigma n=1 Tax=Dimargaris verticillata TaxID=2761393 RepID=A0A9W8B0I4_9FUNG|nr:AP-1 adaptor complex sigma subunit Aps1 [Dimargaris verticillata]